MNTPNTAALKNPVPQEKSAWLVLSLCLLLGLALRLALAPLVKGHPTDIQNFLAWCVYVSRDGLFALYHNPGVFCDYPPLYPLVLRGLGAVAESLQPSMSGFVTLLKTPAILADLGCSLLIYRLLRQGPGARWALGGALLYLLHPVSLYLSAVWGQIDSLTLLLQLLALERTQRGHHAQGLVLSALNILLKPQGLILLPLQICVALRDRAWRDLALGTLGSCLLAIGLSLPVTQELGSTLPWLWQQYSAQAALYPHSSIQAFNLWGLSGMWLPDHRSLLTQQEHAVWWLQHRSWGLLAFASAYALALWQYLRRAKDNPNAALWLSAALILLAFFLLPTRMHERYLFSGLFVLIPAMAYAPRLKLLFGLYSGTLLLNLLWEFPGQHAARLEAIGAQALQPVLGMTQALTPDVITGLCLLNLAGLGAFFWLQKKPAVSDQTAGEYVLKVK